MAESDRLPKPSVKSARYGGLTKTGIKSLVPVAMLLIIIGVKELTVA